MAASGEYQFASWSRAQIGALLEGAARPVDLILDGTEPIQRTVAPYGPGEVTGLDARAVLRTTPRGGAQTFEPNLFASVELAHPGLPWMLSSSADPIGRPMPWIALVVVEEQAGVALRPGPGGGSILVIDAPADPARELPEPGQAWAWAHAQTTGVTGAEIDESDFARSRGDGRSRLIAPRKLEAGRRYIACIVPTAWSTQTPVEIPVYYSWRFTTGPGGDFASLVKLLEAERLAAGIGTRIVDVSDPGWGLPSVSSLAMEITGALRSETEPAPLPEEVDAIGDAILDQIDTSANTPAGEPPILPLPFYGAAATRADDSADSPPWQDELNSDLRQRIAAGLGAEIVRRNQDELVGAAWRAAGEAERANQVIRHAELAAEVTVKLAWRHLARLESTGELLAVARPLLSRMPFGASTRRTLAAAIRASAMPTAALLPALRRLTRSGGRTPARSGLLLERIDTGAIRPVPPKALASGAAGFDAGSKAQRNRARFRSATPVAIDSAARKWKAIVPRPPRRALTTALRRRTEVPDGEQEWTPTPISELPEREPARIDEFAAAARAHQAYIVEHLLRIPDRAPASLGDLGAIRATIEAQWTPARGILLQLGARLEAVPSESAGTLTPVIVRPVLERPLIHALAAISMEHVLPGASQIAANRVGIAVPEDPVARAILVGANEELGRELLWRGFPGALGHTWLRTFWGRVERVGTVVRAVPDIDAIEDWPPEGPVPPAATVVLVVRGEVLHRYPNALVYASPARWDGAYRRIGAEQRAPVFATTLGSDLALFGFELSKVEARGSDAPPGPPGWYFVIAEHPSEPRFGLAASRDGALATWREVAWSDVGDDDLVGNYLRVDRALSVQPADSDGLSWGADAAQMAAITLRRPTRVAIHASRLLPGDE